MFGGIFFRRLADYFSDDWRIIFPMFGGSFHYAAKIGRKPKINIKNGKPAKKNNLHKRRRQSPAELRP